MKRPKLSLSSFLKHLFAPKTNALPTGIRARKLVGTKGRSKARLAAYNRMSGASQEVLRQAGLREEYLKGQSSLKDARGILRAKALQQGYAKPTKREKQEAIDAGKFTTHVELATWAASRIGSKLREVGRQPNYERMVKNLTFLTDQSLVRAVEMEIGEIRQLAGDDDLLITLPDGRKINPFWYN